MMERYKPRRESGLIDEGGPAERQRDGDRELEEEPVSEARPKTSS